MDRKKYIAHRGQWEGQSLPNSFEVSQLYKTGVEADVMLLNDGETLAVTHPSDFGVQDEFFEGMSPADFAAMKVKKGEKQGGATPFFSEYLAMCYDRGISAHFEIKGSTPEVATRVARKIVEIIKTMQTEGAFKVQGSEHPEFLEQMSVHSFSAEAITEAKRALEETGMSLKLGFTCLSDREHVVNNPIAATALRYYQKGDSWERAGLKVAKDLQCNFIFFVEPSKITNELVGEAHDLGLQLYVYIRSALNSAALREELLSMKVDKLLY